MSKSKPQVLSYAERMRLAMKTANNPTGEVLTIREVARRIRYSYEHVRKAYKGEPVVSQEFNAALSKLLGWNEDEMWRLAQREKLHHKFGPIGEDLQAPKDKRLLSIWERMTPEERKKLTDIAEGIVLQREALEARERIGMGV